MKGIVRCSRSAQTVHATFPWATVYRYATLREKSIGGRALPNSMTSDLGTVQVMWRDCVKTGTS